MSDPQSSLGEPVDEPTNVDDVVGRANEGLADAEAAAADPAADSAVVEPAAAEPTPVAEEIPMAAEDWDAAAAAVDSTYVAEPVASQPVDSAAVSAEPVAEAPIAAEPVAEVPIAEVPIAEVPIAAGAAATALPVAPQPIFVQAPEPPLPRGNRAAAGAIGLLAALCFAALYLAAWIGVDLITGATTVEGSGTVALDALATWSLWVPVVVFFVAFWLLGAIINRGRWGHWVIFGLLVGVAAYGGHILGALFQAPFWELTASEGTALVGSEMLAPLAIAAFVIGRELTIWFGAWVAARGKKVTELNVEAQREYERTLEAGPTLVRQS